MSILFSLSFNPLSLMKSTRLFRNVIFLFSLVGLGSVAWGERYETLFVKTENNEIMNNTDAKIYLKSDSCLSSDSISLQEGESAYVFSTGASKRPTADNFTVSNGGVVSNPFVSVVAIYENLDSNISIGEWDGNFKQISNTPQLNVQNDTRISGPAILKISIKPSSARNNSNHSGYWAYDAGGTTWNWEFQASEGFVTFRIVGSEQAPSKKFATVIPEDASGNVRIVLEQSTDLINWSSANPGVFPPSTSKRFFRVRSVEE